VPKIKIVEPSSVLANYELGDVFMVAGDKRLWQLIHRDPWKAYVQKITFWDELKHWFKKRKARRRFASEQSKSGRKLPALHGSTIEGYNDKSERPSGQ